MGKKIKLATMGYEESVSSSLELAKKIEGTRFSPDGVIGIALGGVLPAQIISDYFECPMVLIRVARPMTSMKKYFGLNKLPKFVKFFLRKIEMYLGIYRIMEKREISEIIGQLKKEKYVIVDDSLDTGKTIKEVVNLLEYRKKIVRKDILIAVLTQIFDDADPQADCRIHKNVNFSFPWSRDSSEYSKFVNFCLKRPNLSKFDF